MNVVLQFPHFGKKVQQENLIAKIPNKKYDDVILGMYTNYTPDFSLTSGGYSLIIGYPVTDISNIPEGMTVKEVPAAKYAVFTAKGPFATAVYAAWMEVWQANDLERTFTNDFEWYDSKSTNDENSIVKIYVAIK